MRRHETDVTSLVFGLVFLGITGLWALVQYDVLSLPDASTVAPAVLVVAGLIGVVATVRRASRARREAHQHTVGEVDSASPQEPVGAVSSQDDDHL